MTTQQRWGTDEQGVPRLWFAPLALLVTLLAQLLFYWVVPGSLSWSEFAGSLTFAAVFAGLLEANRRRLRARRSPGANW